MRDHVFIEEDFPPAEIFPIFPSKIRTLVTDEGRITRYSSGELEVYDWAGDPEERVNLAVGDRDPKRVASLSNALTDALIDYSDTARPEPEGLD